MKKRDHLRQTFFGARLIALENSGEEFRPIAISSISVVCQENVMVTMVLNRYT